MKKILFVATIHKHFIRFHLPYIKWLKEHGYTVHCVANGIESVVPYVDKKYDLDFKRTPYSFRNIKIYKELKGIIEDEKYDLVYCHTAIGAALSRLAARDARKKGITKVLYTAHGFSFSTNSPIRNWILYYPIEKYLSRYADGIVTINKEDYNLVNKRKFLNKRSYMINGIGINTERLIIATDIQRLDYRKKNGLKESDFILIYIAEYIYRKNHKFIIDSLSRLIKRIPDIVILFAGQGKLMKKTIEYAKHKKVESHIRFLGFRNDIGELIAMSDVGISASRMEGLGLNIAEEMFCGLPVVASQDKGHKEMIIDNINGFLYSQGSHKEFIDKVTYLYQHPSIRLEMGKEAYKTIQKFKLENSLESMSVIFNEFLK